MLVWENNLYRDPWKIRAHLLLFKLKHSFNYLLLIFPSMQGSVLCLILQQRHCGCLKRLDNAEYF